LIEEAPARGVDAATRAAVCEPAVCATDTVDYVGTGMVELTAMDRRFVAPIESGSSE
jgi:3-methylcrotonyl-CoA carboxylase alpha subunit